jgi:hypothetical protein
MAPGDPVNILRRGGNHFDGNKALAFRLSPTMHAFTIFIQRPNDQASLLAKCCPHQSARFILRNQGLDLGQTTSPLNHSHFAHIQSASLNAAQEKGALLRRILKKTRTTPDDDMALARKRQKELER